MKDNKNVPEVVINRLPRYYRYLGDLLKQDIKRISSNALSEKMNVTASQIRQDYNYFGGFGQQGYGYNVDYLYNEIGKILGLNDGDTMIIVGAGNLGRALASHSNFEKRGFKLVGIFDNNPDIIGSFVNGVQIADVNELEDFLANNRVDIAVLATPKNAVQTTAERLVNCGIRGLLNFSYTELSLPADVAVWDVNTYILYMSRELLHFLHLHKRMVCNIKNSSLFPMLLSILLDQITGDIRVILQRICPVSPEGSRKQEAIAAFYAGGVLNCYFRLMQEDATVDEALFFDVIKQMTKQMLY